MNSDSVRGVVGALVILSLIATAVPGCRMADKDANRAVPQELWVSAPTQVKIRKEITNLIKGTAAESEEAENKLKNWGHQALYWLGAELKEKRSREIEEIISDIMVEILLKDASSVHKEHREQAVSDLVNLDKRSPVIDQLLLRLETSDQQLANSIFKVLERREYISGRWSWPDQAWEELSVRFANNIKVIEPYVTYKLSNLPRFDARTMNWDDYDAEYSFTVLSEMVLSEQYTDLGPLFTGMLEAFAPRVRKQATRVLGHIKYTEAAQKLTDMLTEDPSASVKAACAEALGRMKAEEIASTTLVVLLRKGELLGSSVCWALGEMRTQKAVSALIQLVENPAAMLALGKIGNELAVRPLIRILKTSTDPREKMYAARALGYFNTNEALQALKKAYPGILSHNTRAEILLSIFKMEPKAHKAAVESLKNDYEIRTRLGAMVQLNAKGSLDDMDKMLELLESLKPEERMWYWETIEQSFEGIPSYYPFGLRHKRTESIQQIREWFKESRPNLYYDEENHIWKVRKP